MSTVQVAPERTATIDLSELEALIRQAVREEVRDVMAEWLDGGPTIIEPGSPLYQDLEDIERRAQEGKLEFHTYDEVWG